MLIGMRNAMLAGSGGWKNPYVTDGLIAMWDGEWNAGPGKHDANAANWKDCVNGYIATFNGNVTIGDNYIDAAEGISAPVSVGEDVVTAIRSGAMTYETVMRPLENMPNFASVVLRSVQDNYTHFRVDFNNTINNRFATTVMNTQKYTEVGANGWYNYIQSIYTYVTGNSFYSRIKSSYGSKTANGTFSSANHTADRFSFGGWDGADQLTLPRSKRFWNIRFYNRVLTTAEKNANKEVDVERFGCVRW